MTNEFEELVKKSYLEIVEILVKKYCPARYDYFCSESCVRNLNPPPSEDSF